MKGTRAQGVIIKRLIVEPGSIAVAQFDAETHFRARAAAGSAKKGLRAVAKSYRHLGTAAGK